MAGKRKKAEEGQEEVKKETKKKKPAEKKKSAEKPPESNGGESVSIGEEDFQAMAEQLINEEEQGDLEECPEPATKLRKQNDDKDVNDAKSAASNEVQEPE